MLFKCRSVMLLNSRSAMLLNNRSAIALEHRLTHAASQQAGLGSGSPCLVPLRPMHFPVGSVARLCSTTNPSLLSTVTARRHAVESRHAGF